GGARRLAQHTIDLRRDIPFPFDEGAPASKKDDRDLGRPPFNRRSNLPAIDVRHSEIGYHHIKPRPILCSRMKSRDTRLPTVSYFHFMTVALKHFLEQLSQQRLIVNTKNF